MIDPFLYPGVAVDLTRRELRKGVKYARFWQVSHSPQNAADGGMAWCFVWRKQARRPTLRLLPLNALSLSQNPTEPPPLPDWACEPPGERDWQRELRETLERVTNSVRGQSWSTL
jgi:hypothetical protein